MLVKYRLAPFSPMILDSRELEKLAPSTKRRPHPYAPPVSPFTCFGPCLPLSHLYVQFRTHSARQTVTMRLTAELIQTSLSYLNPLKERELDLRGALAEKGRYYTFRGELH